MELLQDLNWRYATKRMTGEKIPQEKVEAILEAIRLSASSMGFQPYSVVVVEDPEVRRQIQAKAANQPQVVESSHLLIFAAWDSLSEEQVATYMNQIAAERGVPLESLAGFSSSINGLIKSRTPEENFNWAARQAYIALGTGLVAASAAKVDSTPMEGFNPAALDELLGLREKGLRSVALLALGYRDAANDVLATAKKVRRPAEEFFLTIS
ncbi:NAD(P)H-dependent oxidoreductase [Rufibacter glacialis]|uniref:NAD(P)H-dependent oxidoreductase n=1 Tax=Rufibacter glacialis TaxID=1259555 RepID=A0A5M8Q769_9BACT|nr:NAD(P)H-dependent oxidoreductase [Rufibacter glacialis]KAA6431775.1 NAD(P)H-dependent oxidoreductase [Rufibacter glacialis]GGK81677.1 nitroreductase [Rufibacter glacialis]